MATPRGGDGGRLLARLSRPRADERTVLGIVADPHVATRAEGGVKRFEHSEGTFRTALADAEAHSVDAILSPGDLTKDGEPWNYDAVDDALAALDPPFYAVPGNHDVPKDGDGHNAPSLESFDSRYGTGNGYPFHVRVAGVDVVGLNSAGSADRLYESHEGAVDESQLDRARTLLADCEDPIVLNHFNLPRINEQIRSYRAADAPELGNVPLGRDGERLEAMLTRTDVPLVVSGHLHLPMAARQGPVTEVVAPATSTFPQSYLLLDVGPGGTDIRFVPTADLPALQRGCHVMAADGATSRALLSIGATRLATFPLVDDG